MDFLIYGVDRNLCYRVNFRTITNAERYLRLSSMTFRRVILMKVQYVDFKVIFSTLVFINLRKNVYDVIRMQLKSHKDCMD
jgi:hypothetical protein